MTSFYWLLLPWLAFASLFAPAATAANEADLALLLDKVFAAYGGGHSDIKAIRQTGFTFSAMRGTEAPIVRAFQNPDRLRIEIRYPDKAEIRVLRGPHAWKQGQTVSDAFQNAMVLQATRMAMPWNLAAIRNQLRDMGTMNMPDGQALRVLEWTTDRGMIMRIGVAPESGRIVHSLGRLASTPGSMEFGTTYEDFRLQDGRLYAALERHYAMGQAIGHTRIEQVEFLDSLPDPLFQPDPEQPSRLRL